jgi:hypothetical protein
MTNRNPFRPAYRELSDHERELVEQIKDQALALHLLFDRTGLTIGQPALTKEQARYVALARTALEESVMWATKAVTT